MHTHTHTHTHCQTSTQIILFLKWQRHNNQISYTMQAHTPGVTSQSQDKVFDDFLNGPATHRTGKTFLFQSLGTAVAADLVTGTAVDDAPCLGSAGAHHADIGGWHNAVTVLTAPPPLSSPSPAVVQTWLVWGQTVPPFPLLAGWNSLAGWKSPASDS